MAGFERVVAYIGAPKTGTTSVQSFLWESRAALIEQGFYIPATGRGLGQHIELPVAVHTGSKRPSLDRHADPRDASTEARRSRFIADLDNELARAPRCHTLLLFSEYMFSSNLKEVEAYRAFFARFAPWMESVMYLRRQDQWLASLTLQSRKAGTRSNLDLNRGSPDRFGAGIRAWDAQSDQCHVRRFDQEFLTGGNIIEDFCAVIGADTSSLSTTEIRTNPSIFQEQLELLDALNDKLGVMPFSDQIHYRRRFVSLCCDTVGGTRIEFDRETAKTTFDSFKRINRWLCDNRDPEGPEFFFRTDFSGYSEQPANDRRYSDDRICTLHAAILGLIEERGLTAPALSADGSRPILIDHMLSAFIALREAELADLKKVMRAARGERLGKAADESHTEPARKSRSRSMTKFKRVLLYIGAPKTGTTSIQLMLNRNRAELRRQGIYIPEAGRGGIRQHIELPGIVLKGGHQEDLERHANLGDDDRKMRRRDFMRDMESDLEDVTGCHTLLMFSEHMFYTDAEEVPAYRALLDRFAPRFESLMYVRRQDRWLASLNLQRRKSVADDGLELDAIPPRQYGERVRAWDATSDRCLIRRFEPEFLVRGDLIKDFCGTVELDVRSLTLPAVQANPSILQEQGELMDVLNEKLADLPAWRQVPLRRGFIPLCTTALGGAKVEFPRDSALFAFESFREINTWLRETRDPAGPPLYFNTDFSDYLENPDNGARYTMEQLLHLRSVIGAQLGERGAAPTPPEGPSRSDLIDAIASGFLSLRRAEMREARQGAMAARVADLHGAAA